MKYTFTDQKLTFSPRVEALHRALEPRLKHRDCREMTFTGPEYDGKTPFLDVFEEMPDAPYVEALAHAIVRSWLVSDPVILPNEILVGTTRPIRLLQEHFSYGIKGYEHVIQDDPLWQAQKDSVLARYEAQQERMDPGAVQMEAMHEEGRQRLGKEAYEATEDGLWWTGGYQGHTIPGYPKLLSWGLDRTLEEIEKYASNTTDPKKLEFYRAQRIIVEGLSAYALQYAQKADSLAQETPDGAQKELYLGIAENCRRVAHFAPETFWEAAQLMWFYSLWDWVDSIGRSDQYFWPFYAKNVDLLPREDIAAAWIFKIQEHGVHNMTLGGVDPKTGADATNELTYLLLQILRKNHDVYPRTSVRIHSQTPKEVMDLIVTMWSEGMSDPTVVSDTLVIDGLRRYGVTTEDARDYAMLGCQEIEIPGKSNFGCEDGSLNLAKLLEYTIYNGYDRRHNVKVGPATGEFVKFTSMEEIWEAFRQQVVFFTRHMTDLCSIGQTARDKNFSKLVKSVTTDDCMARGINQDAGGTVYNYGVVETAGLAVTADALAALEKLVFQEKKFTLEEIFTALDANFEGYEEMRHALLSAPKFGNDDDFVDAWAVRVLELFWSEIGKYKSVRGGAYMGACSLLTAGINYGNKTWALPDGHRMGDPLGNTMGPRPGADKSGVTAMLKSVAKLPLHLGLGGTTLNVLVPCKENDSPEKKEKIAALFRAYLENGGQMAQITTASVEEMRDAQIHPEFHQNLIVRVGGYSAHFNECPRETQEEIISRYV